MVLRGMVEPLQYSQFVQSPLFINALSVMRNLTHLTLDFYKNLTTTLDLKCFPLIYLKIMHVKTSILTLPNTLQFLHVAELVCDTLPPFLEDLNATLQSTPSSYKVNQCLQASPSSTSFFFLFFFIWNQPPLYLSLHF